MRIKKVVWLSSYVEKLWQKHSVSVSEVEEVLFDHPHIRFVERGHRPGENLYAAYGQTVDNRYLIILFILKSTRRALIISARDMDSKERKLYERRKQK